MSHTNSIETLELGPTVASPSQKDVPQLDSSSRQQITVIDPHGSMEQLNAEDAEGDNVQELAPIDGGWHAWRFVAAGFMVEVMIWGFQVWSVATPSLHLLVLTMPCLLPQLWYFPRSGPPLIPTEIAYQRDHGQITTRPIHYSRTPPVLPLLPLELCRPRCSSARHVPFSSDRANPDV